MKKKLNIDSIENELKGSVFFPQKKEETTPPPVQPQARSVPQEEQQDGIVIPRYHDTMKPSNHDTMRQDYTDAFEVVRKAVKQIGKEAATHRFTLEEKNMLADIEYSYRRQGIRTSENEITRIAINYFVADYRQNGENSLLAKILKRLKE